MIIKQWDQQHQPTLKPRTNSIFNSHAAELFQNVATFKSLGRVQIIIECIHKEIRNRLNLRKTCYNLSHYLLSSHLLVKTYLLTPCSRVLLEKLTGYAANQEIPPHFMEPES